MQRIAETMTVIKEEKAELDSEVEDELKGELGLDGGGDIESDSHDGHVVTAADGTGASGKNLHHHSKQSHSAVLSSNALKKATRRRKSEVMSEYIAEHSNADSSPGQEKDVVDSSAS